MAEFYYFGYESGGTKTNGTVEAKTLQAAAKKLHNEGILVVELSPMYEDKKSSGLSIPLPSIELDPVTIADLLMFCRQMYTFTKSGIPVDQSLNHMSQEISNKKLAKAVVKIREYVSAGNELSAAIAQHDTIFPNVVVSLIRIGEKSGELETAFSNIIYYLTYIDNSTSQVKSMLRYPAIIMTLAIGAFSFFAIFVIPKFKSVLSQFGVDLPIFTKIMINTSDFMANYWYFVFGGIALIIGAFIAFIRSEYGKFKWHKFQMKLPVFGIIIYYIILARFCRIFAITLKSGINIGEALALVANSIGNIYVEDILQNMIDSIERGDSVTACINRITLFPSIMRQMISAGEQTGELESMLTEVAEYFEREVDFHTKKIKDYIEPFIMLVLGGMMMVMALGIFLPVWDLAAGGGH